MTTLADRKAHAATGTSLPTETVVLTFLSGEKPFNELKTLDNQVTDLQVQAKRLAEQIEEEAEAPRPRKGSVKATPVTRKAEIDGEIEEHLARMTAILSGELAEHQEEAHLVGMTSGEWQLWRAKHPPRITGFKEIVRKSPDGSEVIEQGDPIYHDDDLDMAQPTWATKPSCNAAAVDAMLVDRFITKVGDDELEEGGWLGWLADAILWQNRRSLVRTIVGMQERAMVRLPKAPSSQSTLSESGSSD